MTGVIKRWIIFVCPLFVIVIWHNNAYISFSEYSLRAIITSFKSSKVGLILKTPFVKNRADFSASRDMFMRNRTSFSANRVMFIRNRADFSANRA